MIKDVLTQMDLSVLTTAGLILFFIVFLAVMFYAFTCSSSQTQRWSRIPLTSDTRESENLPRKQNP